MTTKLTAEQVAFSALPEEERNRIIRQAAGMDDERRARLEQGALEAIKRDHDREIMKQLDKETDR